MRNKDNNAEQIVAKQFLRSLNYKYFEYKAIKVNRNRIQEMSMD